MRGRSLLHTYSCKRATAISLTAGLLRLCWGAWPAGGRQRLAGTERTHLYSAVTPSQSWLTYSATSTQQAAPRQRQQAAAQDSSGQASTLPPPCHMGIDRLLTEHACIQTYMHVVCRPLPPHLPPLPSSSWHAPAAGAPCRRGPAPGRGSEASSSWPRCSETSRRSTAGPARMVHTLTVQG